VKDRNIQVKVWLGILRRKSGNEINLAHLASPSFKGFSAISLIYKEIDHGNQ
jgi:hypothetical protein